MKIARCRARKANQGGDLICFLFCSPNFPVNDREWRDGGEMANDEAAIKPAAGK